MVLGKRGAHAAVVALSLAPLGWLALGAVRGDLGANPVETITHVTGEWALRFLLACLAVTPLRRVSPRFAALAPYRRTFGLLAFAYAALHAATFFALDLGFAFALLAEEVAERPYVSLGFGALALMTPLALTSTRAAQRRLGRRWITLHRAVYAAGVLAAAHFVWLVKADLREPLLYAAVLAALLAARAIPALRRANAQRAGRPSSRANASPTSQ
ncbi:MAG: sulfoxide reductase heme-binding subunit YedZ [Deltaproteobacteria bacterium]|nr:sulfoxide reductase heme-binding subunit YedZ [Deltaproteobacteria bacterium]